MATNKKKLGDKNKCVEGKECGLVCIPQDHTCRLSLSPDGFDILEIYIKLVRLVDSPS